MLASVVLGILPPILLSMMAKVFKYAMEVYCVGMGPVSEFNEFSLRWILLMEGREHMAVGMGADKPLVAANYE
jgi:hypothetical protein